MCLKIEGFVDLITKWWNKAPERKGNKAFIFFKKLQFVKDQLKIWNREHFGNIFDKNRRSRHSMKAQEISIINNESVPQKWLPF